MEEKRGGTRKEGRSWRREREGNGGGKGGSGKREGREVTLLVLAIDGGE